MKTLSGIAVLVGCAIVLSAAGCSGAPRMRPPCHAMEAGFRPDPSQAAQYPYAELKEGHGLILFVRPSRFSPEEVIEVLVNGRNAGVLRAKRYTPVHVKPGRNRFLARATGREPVEFDLLVEPGKVYFVEVAPGRRGMSAEVLGRVISPEDGRKLLSSCELEGRGPGALPEEEGGAGQRAP